MLLVYVTQDILVGLLRLRKCAKNVTCPELKGRCSIVRELHVYGTAVPVHARDADKLQHQVSFWKNLLKYEALNSQNMGIFRVLERF